MGTTGDLCVQTSSGACLKMEEGDYGDIKRGQTLGTIEEVELNDTSAAIPLRHRLHTNQLRLRGCHRWQAHHQEQ